MENLKSCRIKAGLTQEQLSQKSGISRATIIMLESGKQKEVKTSTVIKLADALNVDLKVLLCPSS